MIRLSQLTLRRGAKALLEGADLTLHAGDRAGLIGANGSGKTSLFALLRDELHADKGDVELPAHWRIAHVAQETPALDRVAVEYVIDGDTTLRRLEQRGGSHSRRQPARRAARRARRRRCVHRALAGRNAAAGPGLSRTKS